MMYFKRRRKGERETGEGKRGEVSRGSVSSATRANLSTRVF